MTRKKSLDTLGKVMSKVASGKKLTARERKLLSAAIDASKKAKSEYPSGLRKRKRKHGKKKKK